MKFEKRILPLAGIVQSIHLVISAAKSGLVSQDSMEKSIRPIFVQSPDSISDVYSGTQDITLGLNLTRDILTDFQADQHAELVKYSLAVMGLEQMLIKDQNKMAALGTEIERIQRRFTSPLTQDGSMKAPSQSPQHEEGIDVLPVPPITDDLIKDLAEVYENIIGTIQPRIKIAGNRSHLQNMANVHRIRALLLAAIRSAVLWDQVGGRRWQLLLQRGAYRSALSSYQ